MDQPDSASPPPDADLGMGAEGAEDLWEATPTPLEKRPSYDEAITIGVREEEEEEEEGEGEGEGEEFTFEYRNDRDPFPVGVAPPTSILQAPPTHLVLCMCR